MEMTREKLTAIVKAAKEVAEEHLRGEITGPIAAAIVAAALKDKSGESIQNALLNQMSP